MAKVTITLDDGEEGEDMSMSIESDVPFTSEGTPTYAMAYGVRAFMHIKSIAEAGNGE